MYCRSEAITEIPTDHFTAMLAIMSASTFKLAAAEWTECAQPEAQNAENCTENPGHDRLFLPDIGHASLTAMLALYLS